MSYPSGSSSIPPSPSVPPPPSGFPPEFEEPEISTVVCPAFWALSNARVAARVGTGEKLIPAKMSFRSSPGTNWMFTPAILAAYVRSTNGGLACYLLSQLFQSQFSGDL